MLTVLMATRNRARTLEAVLERYCRLEPPAGGWQLVVVDNGSDDDTGKVLDRFAQRLPIVTLHEPRPGKNAALNRGLSQARGDLLVCTDDDAFPRQDWLVQLRHAADAHPEVSVFGGTVLPRWECEPPGWVLEWVPLGPTFTLTDPHAAEGPTGAHNVYGPNMAIRMSALDSKTRFDESIGPTRGNYAMGSETELVRRLLDQGHGAWFVKPAVVEHLVQIAQLDRAWILERAVRFGRGQYRLTRQRDPAGAPGGLWLGAPRYLYRLALHHAMALAWAALRQQPAEVFRARWELKYLQGALQEARTDRKEIDEDRPQ